MSHVVNADSFSGFLKKNPLSLPESMLPLCSLVFRVHFSRKSRFDGTKGRTPAMLFVAVAVTFLEVKAPPHRTQMGYWKGYE